MNLRGKKYGKKVKNNDLISILTFVYKKIALLAIFILICIRTNVIITFGTFNEFGGAELLIKEGKGYCV